MSSNPLSRNMWVLVILTAVAGCSVPASPLGSGLDQEKPLYQLTPTEVKQLCHAAVRMEQEVVTLQDYCLIGAVDYALGGLYEESTEEPVEPCQRYFDGCALQKTNSWQRRDDSCEALNSFPYTTSVEAAETCTKDVIDQEANASSKVATCADLPAFVASYADVQAAMLGFNGYPASCASATDNLLP